MQTAYKAELERLTKEGIITEVKEHTEWINLIVPVMKPNSSLRLCLDPKALSRAIKRNQWYSRTIDDILPEIGKSKFKTSQRCDLRLLACSLRLGQQSTHHIQHPMGQI